MSSGIDFQLVGVPQFKTAVSKIEKAADDATKEAVLAAGEAVVTFSRAMFDGRSGGPARRSGALADSLTVTKPNGGLRTGWTVKIGPTSLPYARKVELGKTGKGSARPYPYLRPGFQEASKTFDKTFRDAWQKAL